MSNLLAPLKFVRGPEIKNRFILAPLTNTQSYDDGRLSEEEFKWLTMRASGGFGLTMTCAAHVQAIGQGFPGQLGVFSEIHLSGLTRLAKEIKSNNSMSICQLHHAGMRSPEDIIGEPPVCPSDNEEFSARALSLEEVTKLRDDFISAAIRCEKAGFDGVELHGAHGYILGQFLSGKINIRTDKYGGSKQNRSRILQEIIDGIRRKCNSNFVLGVRLSPERFGIDLGETKALAEKLMTSGEIDFLDMSLWDVFKDPSDKKYKGWSLLSHFTGLERGNTKLGVAGNIRTPIDAEKVISNGVDWVMLGKAAILHHDFPSLYKENSKFIPVELPVSYEYLKKQGLSDKFVNYMSNWKGFVEPKK